MAVGPEDVLFQAVSTPPRSFSRPAYRVLSVLVCAATMIQAALFLWLGAWPVLGFMGLEVALVLGLIALHERWSARRMEVISLRPGRLTVARVDHRGRRSETAVEPYWARLRLEERGGEAGRLVIESRGRSVEIGRHLNGPEKREMAEALEAALREYRAPRFENPQLG